MDPRWKHPFTCIVAGPTGCGKTTFVARLLRYASSMIDPPPENITWCYGQWQPVYETLTRQVPHLSFEEGLPESSVCNPTTNNLVVIDDLMAETDARVTTLFTQKATMLKHFSTVPGPKSVSNKTQKAVPLALKHNTWWFSIILATRLK